MTQRRITLIAIVVATAHLAVTSLLGQYVAYQVGGRAGENIARLITETYESNGAESEASVVERYQEVKKSVDASVERWHVALMLLSLPAGFAIEQIVKPIRRHWFDQVLAHELSAPQWRARMYALVAIEYVLNSAALGLLVYLALRMVRRLHAP